MPVERSIEASPTLQIMEFRVDRVGISGVKRTPQGGLDVPAALTRSGVFTYRRADGSVQRELRHPDDVFSSAHLDSLGAAPVTVGHPGMVTPANWKQHSVGHVRDNIKREDHLVVANLAVQDQQAVDAVERGDLVELSCGYSCDLDMTPGEFNGEKYDARQVNQRINHVALLPKDGGRAGNEVRLRMDGVNVATLEGNMTLDEALKEIDRLKGELAGVNQRADAANKKVASIDIDALVNDRMALVADASLVLGKEKLDGVAELDVLKKTCSKAYPEEKLDGKSEDYLRGLFNAAVRGARDAQEAVGKVNVRVDSTSATTEDKVAKARARNEERARNMWKGGN